MVDERPHRFRARVHRYHPRTAHRQQRAVRQRVQTDGGRQGNFIYGLPRGGVEHQQFVAVKRGDVDAVRRGGQAQRVGGLADIAQEVARLPAVVGRRIRFVAAQRPQEGDFLAVRPAVDHQLRGGARKAGALPGALVQADQHVAPLPIAGFVHAAGGGVFRPGVERVHVIARHGERHAARTQGSARAPTPLPGAVHADDPPPFFAAW